MKIFRKIFPNVKKNAEHFFSKKTLILPYYQRFVKWEDELKSRSLTDKPNKFCHNGFFKYVKTFLIPYYALWSATNLKELGLQRDSDAIVKNYFKILKNQLHKDEHKMKIENFIKINWTDITTALKRRKKYEILETSKVQFKRKKKDSQAMVESDGSDDENSDIENCIETWFKSKGERLNKLKKQKIN